MSYMKSPTVSYTLRIPKDLRRLMEVSAEANGVTLTSLVVRACWQYLDRVPTECIPGPQVLRDPPQMNPAMAEFLGVAPVEAVEPEMCRYKEYDQESGETMGCGLPVHGGKQRHGNWMRL